MDRAFAGFTVAMAFMAFAASCTGAPSPAPTATRVPSPATAPPIRPEPTHDHVGHEHRESSGVADSSPAPLGHRFEQADEWTKIFDDPARDAWQKPSEVVRVLRVTEGMTIADIGAGTGYFEPYLSKAVGPRGVVIALDIEPDMIRFLRARAEREGLKNVRPMLARTDDPGLPGEGVDRILVADTWHHVPAREAYARKLAAALKPGGLVAIVDYTMTTKRGPPKDHRVTPEQVMGELRAGGLSPELAEEPLPDHYVVFGHRSAR